MTTPWPYRADTAFHPPVPHPRASGHLQVAPGHRIWWEETGPAEGVPILILHGGPGGQIKPYYRRLTDPGLHRAIFFDQRGCGRSEPFGTLDDNDTHSLVADIEALREARNVDRWIVLGGSWGSTLALAYAQAHPDRVTGLAVTGVFLARAVDSWWWWEGGRWLFPEVYAARDALLTPGERANPRAAFLARILDPDPAVHRPAAALLAAAEGQTLFLMAPPPPDDPHVIDDATVAAMRIFAHYDRQDYFLAENQLLDGAAALADIPGLIIAGRADGCTPPRGAWELAERWPSARLRIVPAAGHAWNDEALAAILVPELAQLADRLRR